MRRVLLLCLLLVAAPVDAAELHGRVVGVTDGDTIIVLDQERRQHKVRIAAIDAPERGQPWSARSRQILARLIQGDDVVVDGYKTDRWGRIIGTVWREGEDVGLGQVILGMAWWYRHFADEQSARDRALYTIAEEDARKSRRGLWQDPAPLPPWAWRHR